MTNTSNRPPPKNPLCQFGAEAMAIADEIDALLQANPHWWGDIFTWLCEERDVARAYGKLLTAADPAAYVTAWIADLRPLLDELHSDQTDGEQP